MHALIKELAIRRVEHKAETHSNESQHLAEGTEVARLRRRFSFVLQQALSFRTRGHLCRQGVVLASNRQLRSQGPVSVPAHRIEGVTGTDGPEGANRVGGGIGVGGGNGDSDGVGGGNGDVNGHGDGDGAGGGTGTGVEVTKERRMGTGTGRERERRRGWKSVDEHRMGSEAGSEDSSGDGNRDEDNGNGNEDRVGEGKREAKKRKKPQNSCRRHMGIGGDFDGKRKKCRKVRVSPVTANPDNLESNKESGGGAQGTQGSSKICRRTESVSSLSRLIRGLYNLSPLGGSMRMT